MLVFFLLSILALTATVAVVAVIEWAANTPRRVARTLGFNATYALVIVGMACALQPIARAEADWVTRTFGWRPIALPDRGLWALGSVTLLMLIADFIFYWVHRAQHRFDWLWAMHSFHHSDDDLNGVSAFRHYWIEKPAWMLVFYLPLGFLFVLSPGVSAGYALMFQFFAVFPHLNIRMELGPLTRVLLGPQLHRLHHSVYREHFNSNFCGAFPAWDLIFGTYRAPQPKEFPPTGLPDRPGRASFSDVMLWPVRRRM